jgi:hypothetical protein
MLEKILALDAVPIHRFLSEPAWCITEHGQVALRAVNNGVVEKPSEPVVEETIIDTATTFGSAV